MYSLEFVLHVQGVSLETIQASLSEFAEDLKVIISQQQEDNGRNFDIQMRTEDPTLIFDVCSEFGRIRSIKANEEIA